MANKKQESTERTAYWQDRLSDIKPLAALGTSFGDGSPCPFEVFEVDGQLLVRLGSVVVAEVRSDVLTKCANDIQGLLDGNYGELETHLFDDGYVSAEVSVDNSSDHGLNFDVAVYFDTDQDRTGTDEHGAPEFRNAFGGGLVEVGLSVTSDAEEQSLDGFARTFGHEL